MNKISSDVRSKLAAEGQNKAYVTKLIIQGLLMFLEDKVEIRCRQSDVALVESCLKDAESGYAALIKQQSGVTKTVKLTVDKSLYVPATSLGGVVLVCGGGKITIDNTIDLRLNLAMEQDKPAIRSILFP